ncbi:MAG: hypothetical protein VB013_06680 [Anaerolineaceae bacterium]|nr:hypothetical protein [Anaerolineaceae bacterium]
MKKTFYLTPSYWVSIIPLTLVFLALGIYMVIFYIQFEEITFSNIVFLAIFNLMSIGAAGIFIKFLSGTKVITNSTGIEYQSLFLVYRSNWEDLRCAGWVAQGRAGYAFVLYSLNPEVERKTWRRRSDQKNTQTDNSKGIPITWFGDYKSKNLLAEIHEYAPHLFSED